MWWIPVKFNGEKLFAYHFVFSLFLSFSSLMLCVCCWFSYLLSRKKSLLPFVCCYIRLEREAKWDVNVNSKFAADCLLSLSPSILSFSLTWWWNMLEMSFGIPGIPANDVKTEWNANKRFGPDKEKQPKSHIVECESSGWCCVVVFPHFYLNFSWF